MKKVVDLEGPRRRSRPLWIVDRLAKGSRRTPEQGEARGSH
jgi:hypothetical protein